MGRGWIGRKFWGQTLLVDCDHYDRDVIPFEALSFFFLPLSVFGYTCTAPMSFAISAEFYDRFFFLRSSENWMQFHAWSGIRIVLPG